VKLYYINQKWYHGHQLQVIPEDTISIQRDRPNYDPTFFNREQHLRTLERRSREIREEEEEEISLERVRRERRVPGEWESKCGFRNYGEKTSEINRMI